MNPVRVTAWGKNADGARSGVPTRSIPFDGRKGFTLVELLVVVTVMLLLITMTVMTIDFTFKAERIRTAARQVQSALEGARDRAIFAKEPRGLRLLIDPSEPRMVSSMVYVGAGMEWPLSPGTEHVMVERPDFNLDGVADSSAVTIIRFAVDPSFLAGCDWFTLKERGYLPVFEDLNLNGQLDSGEDQNGNGVLDRVALKITIPAEGGRSYTVLTHRLTATNPILELMPGTEFSEPADSGIPPTSVAPFSESRRFTYKLELPPRILPDAQPILLPDGIVIDLDASEVPPNWRPGLPPGPPAPPMPLDQQYAKPYSMEMDIMFSPRGVMHGPVTAQGLIHLYVAERKDVVYAVDQGVMIPPLSSNPLTRRPPRFTGDVPLVPGADQFNPADALIGDRLLITIFTQTGKVSTHKINTVDSNSDGYADAPFLFAVQGKGQSQ